MRFFSFIFMLLCFTPASSKPIKRCILSDDLTRICCTTTFLSQMKTAYDLCRQRAPLIRQEMQEKCMNSLGKQADIFSIKLQRLKAKNQVLKKMSTAAWYNSVWFGLAIGAVVGSGVTIGIVFAVRR